MKDCKRQSQLAELAQAVLALTPEDGSMFLCQGESYLRMRRLDDGGLRIEAPSNELLAEPYWIDAAAVDLLRAAHFALPRGEEMFFACTRDVDERDAPTCVDELNALLETVYGAPSDAPREWFLSASESETPRSARLCNALHAYREAPAEAAWDQLCARLLEADVLLALAPSLDAANATPELRPISGPDGRAAAVAFTSQAAMRRAAPRGMLHARMRGSDAVLAATAHQFHTLVMDPSGPLPVHFTDELLLQLARTARVLQSGL